MGLHHLYGDHADHGSHLPRGASRRGFAASPWGEPKPGRKLKTFLVRKDGHVFAFVYPPEHEGAALAALGDCPTLDPAEVLALACYLGHDPHELGLDELA